jgi:hypothetical protein
MCTPKHVMLSAAPLGGSEASLDDVAQRQSDVVSNTPRRREMLRGPRRPLSMTARMRATPAD